MITVADDSGRPTSAGALEAGDRITVLGDVDVARQFAGDHGLDRGGRASRRRTR